MADVISFKGTDIFSSATNGAGWAFSAGALVEEAIQASPSVGVGYWLKPGNKTPATHRLEVTWRTSSPGSIRSLVEGLATSTPGDLVVPTWGTFANCLLTDIGEMDAKRSDDATGYLVTSSLTFTQFPN